jgi:hypothetical protein
VTEVSFSLHDTHPLYSFIMHSHTSHTREKEQPTLNRQEELEQGTLGAKGAGGEEDNNIEHLWLWQNIEWQNTVNRIFTLHVHGISLMLNVE